MKNLKKVLMSCVCLSLLVVLITGCETKKETKDAKKETKSETKKETKKETNILDDNKSYLFIIDGKKIYAGDKISSLSKFGYNIREKEKDQEVPANKYMIGAGNMTNETNSILFSVTPYNIESSAVKVTDAVIGGFRLSKSYAKNDEKAMNIEVYGKIKLGSTMEEVEKVFGQPESKNEGTGYTTYRYKSEEVYRNYTIRFDENNVVDSIEWQNLVFNN